MKIKSAKIRGYRCFKNEWSGLEEIRPINVIIGKNNVGKSHLLELVSTLCSANGTSKQWDLEVSGQLKEEDLKRGFNPSIEGGALGGNHWLNHGKKFIGSSVRAIFDRSAQMTDFELLGPVTIHEGISGENAAAVNARMFGLREASRNLQSPIGGRKFRHLLAERDIQPESEAKDLSLISSGRGATNIIRRFLVSSSDSVSRELIQRDLLGALNEIFGPDGRFTEITVRLHDEATAQGPANMSWEVFLGEEKKGLISLSRSGSGLKTVILVLLHLLVIPAIEHHTPDSYVYAFEELENNLHPSLFRRLLRFIDRYVTKTEAVVFLTTHSSTALDFFGPAANSQIIHLTHNGESAKATKVLAHFDRVGILTELGAKPSDLLQANGIVWLEGPSDRVYVNRWIELVSKGELREGKDYVCAFFGGSLLARCQFSSPEEADRELSNLLRINGNIAVVCDSDRTVADAPLKTRVARIVEEVGRIPNGHVWITAAKEIENYIPAEVLSGCLSMPGVVAPNQFEQFFPIESSNDSFVESKLGKKSINKTGFAEQLVSSMSSENMESRFDWFVEVGRLVGTIRRWNQ